jgi:hypothetical protein
MDYLVYCESADDARQAARHRTQNDTVVLAPRNAQVVSRGTRGPTAALDMDAASGEALYQYGTHDEPNRRLVVACPTSEPRAAPSRTGLTLVNSSGPGWPAVRAFPGRVTDHPRIFATLTAPNFGRRPPPSGKPRRLGTALPPWRRRNNQSRRHDRHPGLARGVLALQRQWPRLLPHRTVAVWVRPCPYRRCYLPASGL